MGSQERLSPTECLSGVNYSFRPVLLIVARRCQGNIDLREKRLEIAKNPRRGTSALPTNGAAIPNLLLHHPGPRTRPPIQHSTIVERWIEGKNPPNNKREG